MFGTRHVIVPFELQVKSYLDESVVQERICEVHKALLRGRLPFGARAAQPMTLETYGFKHDKKEYNVYWDVRKGLIPIVGAARETGLY